MSEYVAFLISLHIQVFLSLVQNMSNYIFKFFFTHITTKETLHIRKYHKEKRRNENEN